MILDIKEVSNNITIAEENQPYCAIVTQDGENCYKKMTFEYISMTSHFHFIICDALDHIHPTIPRPDHATYLDNCTVGIQARIEERS